MEDRDFEHVIAIGASAGGIEAICELVAGLPANLPAPVVFALHSRETLVLPRMIAQRTTLPVVLVETRMPLVPGTIYVCEGGMQTVFEGRDVVPIKDRLDERFAPSVDLLFRTLGEQHGKRGIAVVLSGMLDDGAAGALNLFSHGATVIVQDPDDAKYASMPESVIARDHPRAVLTATELAEKLVELTRN